VTVEFAATASAMLLFVFGALEFSKAAAVRQSIELALYESARHGIVSGATSADVTAEARRILNVFGVRTAQIVVTPSTITDTTDRVGVRISVSLEKELSGIAVFFRGTTIDRSILLQREGANAASGS
jgi:Flp pilus assembly protein TadG